MTTDSQKRAAGEQRGRPFRPGESGNPNGRPAGVPNRVTREIREVARAIVDDPEYRESLLARIRQGKLAPAIEVLLWHYAYGKPKETFELSGLGGGPVTFSWMPAAGATSSQKH